MRQTITALTTIKIPPQNLKKKNSASFLLQPPGAEPMLVLAAKSNWHAVNSVVVWSVDVRTKRNSNVETDDNDED